MIGLARLCGRDSIFVLPSSLIDEMHTHMESIIGFGFYSLMPAQMIFF